MKKKPVKIRNENYSRWIFLYQLKKQTHNAVLENLGAQYLKALAGSD